MADDTDWLQKICNMYADGIVFADDYQMLPKRNMPFYMSLRSFAKQEGFKDVREWLVSKSIYIDIERDMYSPDGDQAKLSADDLESGVRAIYRENVLLGQRVLPPAFKKALLERAQEIFDGIWMKDEYRITDIEQDIITLAIVEHVKDRYRQAEIEMAGQFWNYVYTQFGFRPAQEDQSTTSRLYTVLCQSVKSALWRNHRYFASESAKTQRYYTSLMLHALAPVSSMDNLFEILLTFYIEDLDGFYIPGDTAYKTLVSKIASRWDKYIEADDDLHVRSLDIYSGMRVLFSERGAFMRSFCERIVCRIDALLHSPSAALSENDYLDVLMQRWYQNRSTSLEEAYKQRRESRVGMVSSVSSLRVCYALENGHVMLKLPAIRLEDSEGHYPSLQILQNGLLVHTQEMDVYGRLVWTTRAVSVVLEDTEIDFDQLESLRIRIQHGSKTIYDSGKQLNREYILFDGRGIEVNRQRTHENERYCLFTGDSASITYSEDAEIYYEDHRGQLCEVLLTAQSWICVNGQDVWIARDRKSTFRHAASVDKIRNLWAVAEGQQYTIYPNAFAMQFNLPENEKSIRYEIGVDNRWSVLTSHCAHDRNSFSLDVPSDPEKPHCIQFRQITDQRIVYEYRYMIITGVYCSHDVLCFDNGKPIAITIGAASGRNTYTVLPEKTGDEVIVPLAEKPYDLRLKLPLVRCMIGNINGLSLPEHIWHGEISHDSFAHIECPPQWRCTLALGSSAVPASSDRPDWYELGNFLRTHRTELENEPLSLILRNDNEEPVLYFFTDLRFKVCFLQSPLYVDDHRLLWKPEGCYVGPADASLFLKVENPNEDPFQYDLYTRVLDEHFPHDGVFPAKIVLKEKSVFGKGKETILWEEELQFGTPDAYRFKNKYLYPVEARCWDLRNKRYQIVRLNSDCLCIYNLYYVGRSKPCEEDAEMPEYSAWCSFYDTRSQTWRSYNSNEYADDFEWINPVRVWIANDHMLTVKCVSEDGILVDTRFGCFVNRKLTREDENRYVQTPDYIMYRMEDGDDAGSDSCL